MDPLNPDPTASTKKGFLDWQLERYYDTGVVLSRRPSSCIADLLQNCDLPPPLNIFSPIQKHDDDDDDSRVDNNKKSNPLPLPHTSPPPAPAKDEQWDHGGDDASLLRALQLSQTRAREAERKAAIETMRSEQMGGLLVEDSLMLSVHRRWVQVLENEISMLHKHKHMQMLMPKTEEEADEVAVPAATATATAAWCLAVALCLGFVLGRFKF